MDILKATFGPRKFEEKSREEKSKKKKKRWRKIKNRFNIDKLFLYNTKNSFQLFEILYIKI